MSVKVDSEAPDWAISPCPKCGVYTSSPLRGSMYGSTYWWFGDDTGGELVVKFDHSNQFNTECPHTWDEKVRYEIMYNITFTVEE